MGDKYSKYKDIDLKEIFGDRPGQIKPIEYKITRVPRAQAIKEMTEMMQETFPGLDVSAATRCLENKEKD